MYIICNVILDINLQHGICSRVNTYRNKGLYQVQTESYLHIMTKVYVCIYMTFKINITWTPHTPNMSPTKAQHRSYLVLLELRS